MEARTEPLLKNQSPPQAAFKRLHYLAIGWILRQLPAEERKSAFVHFNHYFRGTQEAYDSRKFAEACGMKWDSDAVDLVVDG